MTVGLKSDLATGDLIRQNGSFVVIDGANNDTNEGQLAAQRIRDIVMTGLGEWFLDLDYGFPLIPSSDAMDLQRAIARQKIQQAAGEEFTVVDVSLLEDRQNRILTLGYEVFLPNGQEVSNTVELPI